MLGGLVMAGTMALLEGQQANKSNSNHKASPAKGSKVAPEPQRGGGGPLTGIVLGYKCTLCQNNI